MPCAESTCCSGNPNPKPPKPVKEKKEKPKKEKPEKKPKKEKGGAPAEGSAADAKEKDPKSSGKEKKEEKAKPVPVQVKKPLHKQSIGNLFFLWSFVFWIFFLFLSGFGCSISLIYHFIHTIICYFEFAHHNAFVSQSPHTCIYPQKKRNTNTPNAHINLSMKLLTFENDKNKSLYFWR